MIQNTILAQVYDVVQAEDKDSTLLQRANAAFKNVKLTLVPIFLGGLHKMVSSLAPL